MTHQYKITGMQCNGCRTKVEETLNNIKGLSAVVALDPPVATITMNDHIDTKTMQSALSQLGNYTIKMITGDEVEQLSSCCEHATPKGEQKLSKSGIYYCPMRCEGDKTYSKPGSCPVCGMDLVPLDAEDDDTSYKDLLKKLRVALIFTIPIFILSMGEMIPDNPITKLIPAHISNWIQFTLSLPVIFYAGWIFFGRMWTSFKTGNLNMFTLIGVGSSAAFIFSVVGLLFPSIFPVQFHNHEGGVSLYFEAVTVILTLVLVGQLLESKAQGKTNAAVKELLNLAPNEATLVTDKGDIVIAVSDIKAGDILRVKPGDKIPVDGSIKSGNSSIDESMITGESMPADKDLGDKVSAGTINGNGSFTMIAEKVRAETLLAQIVEMVNQASRSKAPIQKLADKIARYFVPVVFAIAVITFILWAVFGPDPAYVFAFSNALAVLIIACPCALGLATPMSVMVGMGKGAQNGILIKNAETLQNFDKADVLIIDKTGTITEGKPSVERVVAIASFDEKDILKYAASLNVNSNHPLAEAIVDYSKKCDIILDNVADFQSVTGKGVVGKLGGKSIAVGNAKLVADAKTSVSIDVQDAVSNEQSLGKTVSYIVVDGVVAGYILVSDSIKATSREAIKALEAQGMEVLMLTGDNYATARYVANQLGLTDFKAECLPQDKLAVIKEYQQRGRIVVMAGDGINDAPALAQADMGIAMGTGTDIAIESASITLVKGDLRGIVKAKKLSHATMRNIKENLFFAFCYNAVGIPVAAGVLYPFFGILLSPMIAALAMSLSSVSVIVNSLRLRFTKLDN